MGIIYKITNIINNKIYIGQTNDLKRRWIRHRLVAKNGDTRPLYNSIRKYGIENFKIESIESNLPLKKLDEREQYWIYILKSDDLNIGYNLTNGGGMGSRVAKHALHPRPPCSEEQKRRISEANSGKGNGRYGDHDPRPETGPKISKALKNSEKFQKSRKSKEFRQKISDIQSGKETEIVILDTNFNEIKSYKNARYAAEDLGFQSVNISQAARKKRIIGKGSQIRWAIRRIELNDELISLLREKQKHLRWKV